MLCSKTLTEGSSIKKGNWVNLTAWATWGKPNACTLANSNIKVMNPKESHKRTHTHNHTRAHTNLQLLCSESTTGVRCCSEAALKAGLRMKGQTPNGHHASRGAVTRIACGCSPVALQQAQVRGQESCGRRLCCVLCCVLCLLC